MKHRPLYTGMALFALVAIITAVLFGIAPDASATGLANIDPSALGFTGLAGVAAAGFGIIQSQATSKTLRGLQAKRSETTKQWRALNDRVSTENRDPSEEEQNQIDGYKASMERLNKQIEDETALLAAEADAGLQIRDDARIAGGEPGVTADPRRGFRSLGDFAQSVRSQGMNFNNPTDPRLRYSAALPSNYGNESSGADGGFAIPPAFSADIWRLSLGENSLIPMTDNTEISGNSMAFPKDETTPWGGTGVQAYWRNEAAAATASKMALGISTQRLHELMVLVPVTNELLDDAPALGSWIQPLAADRIMWKSNEAILFGTGAGQPKGVLAAGNAALIVNAKESGQAANTIDPKNISKMVSRLLAGELMNAFWLGNPDILPALEAMSVGNYPIYLPNNNVSGASYGMLKGRPLLMSEHANGLSAQSDLSLLSLKGYRTITKAGGIETATSMHIYFDQNAMAFRFIFRLDGEAIISAPIQPPTGKSSNTRSYFITLAAR